MYSSFSLKWTYISSLIFFEVRMAFRRLSLLCSWVRSSAPSRRAPRRSSPVARLLACVVLTHRELIAQLGVAGGYIGTLIIISTSAPIEKRALYSGFVGMVVCSCSSCRALTAQYGVAAIAGPLIGGALTSCVALLFLA